MKVSFSNIKIKADKANDINSLKAAIIKKIRISESDISDVFIDKKSLDARKKPDIYYVYTLVAEISDKRLAKRILDNKKNEASEYRKVKYVFPAKAENLDIEESNRPVIVGLGPAGLFSGYMLAKAGFKPLIIERGKPVQERIKDVERFWKEGVLDTQSNIQFGEGGAGTFSDGKLNTGVKDKYGRISKVLKILVDNGAPDNILYDSKPHIGTDVLTEVVKNMRNYILSHGGEIMYSTRFIRPCLENTELTGLVIEKNGAESTIKCGALILCTGHSSRDTFVELAKSGLDMCSKPFAVGLRVQHSQDMINKSQYGADYDALYNGTLPASDYKVTYNFSNNSNSETGVYSFCMCPGGYVVNASSEEGRLAVNGMSYHGRDSKNANSAIVVTVDSSVFGDGIFAGMHFQERLEENAYKAGKGKIPVQNFEDYCNDVSSTKPYSFEPQIKGQFVYGNNRHILPDALEQAIIHGINYFGNRIQGFNDSGTLLCGVESRTSSPVKIIRDNETLMSNIKNIFPCGEGAGYAGGITSAAVDGLKVAEKIALLYNQM